MIWQKYFGTTDLDSETTFLYWDSCFQVWWSSKASWRWCTWRQWGKQGWSGCCLSTFWSTIVFGLEEGFPAALPDSVSAPAAHMTRVNRPGWEMEAGGIILVHLGEAALMLVQHLPPQQDYPWNHKSQVLLNRTSSGFTREGAVTLA